MQKKYILLIIAVSLMSVIFSDAYAAEEYIVVGNVVNITVLGYPELSKSVVVRQDGTTDYPLLVNVPIVGLTMTELKDLLFPLLTRYVERPRLFINISEFLMLQIRVQGEVRNPGPFQVQGPIDLQGVLSIAGGTLNSADLRNIRILRRNEAGKQTIEIDMYEYIRDEKAALLPDIIDGDIIVVPVLTAVSYVRVMGAVRIPGNYIPVDPTSNVADMINLAGGTVTNSDLNHVYLVSGDNVHSSPKLLKLKNMLDKGQLNSIPLVNPGDAIIVAEYNQWKKTGWWLQMAYYFMMLLSSIVILSRL